MPTARTTSTYTLLLIASASESTPVTFSMSAPEP